MSFEAELKAHLQGDSAISALVGERIHPIIAPENSPSVRITYSLIFGEPVNSLDGHTSGVTRYTVQIDCWAQSFKTVRELALDVRDRMKQDADTFRSVITSYPTIDDFEADTKLYRRSLDVSCWHTEP